MSEAEFRAAHRPVRNFQRYDSDQRANRAASHRLTSGQRQAMGERYYTHPLVPGVAFPTAKAAHLAAWNARGQLVTCWSCGTTDLMADRDVCRSCYEELHDLGPADAHEEETE